MLFCSCRLMPGRWVILIIGLFFLLCGITLEGTLAAVAFFGIGCAGFLDWYGVHVSPTDVGGELAINPWLAGFVSLVGGFFMWFVFNKGIEASLIPTTHNISSVIGMEGTALTAIGREGSVQNQW